MLISRGWGDEGDWEMGGLGDGETGEMGETGETGRLGDWEMGRLGVKLFLRLFYGLEESMLCYILVSKSGLY